MEFDAKKALLFLENLRWRLIRMALFLILGLIFGYYAAPYALNALLQQGGQLNSLVFLSPGEAFMARLKLALALGVLVTLPFLLQQLAGAFCPLLSRSDRRAIMWALPIVYLLFVGGMAFAYLGALPLALRFFLSFGNENLEPIISVGNFITFAIMFALPFGLVFQMPVVIVVLARLGLVKSQWLAKNRKYAVLVIFIVAAVVTPADVFSQVSLAIPMVILYEVSLILARVAGRKREQSRAESRVEV